MADFVDKSTKYTIRNEINMYMFNMSSELEINDDDGDDDVGNHENIHETSIK